MSLSMNLVSNLVEKEEEINLKLTQSENNKEQSRNQ
jgi:hypothetical protein